MQQKIVNIAFALVFPLVMISHANAAPRDVRSDGARSIQEPRDTYTDGARSVQEPRDTYTDGARSIHAPRNPYVDGAHGVGGQNMLVAGKDRTGSSAPPEQGTDGNSKIGA